MKIPTSALFCAIGKRPSGAIANTIKTIGGIQPVGEVAHFVFAHNHIPKRHTKIFDKRE